MEKITSTPFVEAESLRRQRGLSNSELFTMTRNWVPYTTDQGAHGRKPKNTLIESQGVEHVRPQGPLDMLDRRTAGQHWAAISCDPK